jgi:hypothetical protein
MCIQNVICRNKAAGDVLTRQYPHSGSFCCVDDPKERMIRIMNRRNEFTGPVNIGNTGEFTIKPYAGKAYGNFISNT